LEGILGEFDLILSSPYVKMEFQRAFIRKGLIYLHNLTKRVNDFPEILRKLSQLPPMQYRRISITLSALSDFFSDGSSQGLELMEKLSYYLPLAIEAAWQSFDDIIDGPVDQIKCARGAEKPILKDGVYEPFKKCKGSKKQCRIDEFFVDNKKQFESILDKLKVLPASSKDEELIRIEKIIEKVLKHPEYLLEYKNCWNCGDAIIAVECPSSALLLTTNIKHSKPLLESIGKNLRAIVLQKTDKKQLPGN